MPHHPTRRRGCSRPRRRSPRQEVFLRIAQGGPEVTQQIGIVEERLHIALNHSFHPRLNPIAVHNLTHSLFSRHNLLICSHSSCPVS